MPALSEASTISVGVHESSYADIVARLATVFGDAFSLPIILDTVADARADLAGSPPAALPELTERLAHQRLSELV